RFAASAKRIGNRPLPASKPTGARHARAQGLRRPSRVIVLTDRSVPIAIAPTLARPSIPHSIPGRVVLHTGARRRQGGGEQGALGGELAELGVHVGEAGDHGEDVALLLDGDGGGAEDLGVARDVAVDPRLGADDDAVADLGVVLDAGLAGHHDVVARLATAGDADLAAEEVVPADLVVVSDHDEVVDLRPLADG